MKMMSLNYSISTHKKAINVFAIILKMAKRNNRECGKDCDVFPDKAREFWSGFTALSYHFLSANS